MSPGGEPLIRVRDLAKRFSLDAGLFAGSSREVWALNGVSLTLLREETYGLVGESGSGKTTLARALVQLVPHTFGRIEYFPPPDRARPRLVEPWEITRREPEALRFFRSDVKYVFQDPSSSLDPRMSVLRVLTAGARYGARYPGAGRARERALELIGAVGLREADAGRRPSELSGGQRQRVSLARALLGNPAALICDEVVSALDASIRGQILNLLVDLKRRFKLTLVFIAHDLGVVSYMADRIGVMYGGELMEEAGAERLARAPLHPYSRLLYDSATGSGAIRAPAGDPFNPMRPPRGCPFSGRCPLARELCRRERPELREIEPGHRVACHFAERRA